MASTPREILRQIALQEPKILAAFLAMIQEIVGPAKVNQIAELIRLGQLDDIAGALGITQAALSSLTEAIRATFIAGGTMAAIELPALRRPSGGALRLHFDVRSVRAEAWLRTHSSNMVTMVLEDQREAIRTVVSEGTRLGRNPRQTALDIVGRMSATGRRTGGIVGLTGQQTDFVMNARAQLSSSDPDQLRAYLTRTRRDRRFDGIVNRAIKDGTRIKPADVDRLVGRYADRLLKLRGDNIARTEALAAFNEGRDEAMAQAIDTGAIRPQNVKKIWQAAGDSRTRDAHASMHGQTVAWGEPFRSPTGAQLMHPGDSGLGAGAADIINCRCISLNRIDQLAEVLGGR